MAVCAVLVTAAPSGCTDSSLVPSVPQPALCTVESNAYRDALASGTLQERHGCLFLDAGVGAPRLFIPPAGVGFELRSDGVLTRNGQNVARGRFADRGWRGDGQGQVAGATSEAHASRGVYHVACLARFA